MKESNALHKTDVTGEPAPGKHVNLLKQKTTPDDEYNLFDFIAFNFDSFVLPLCLTKMDGLID